MIVFSAGNEGEETTDHFPSLLDDVIGVIASNPDDGKCSPSDGWGSFSSNYGASNDLAAPGTHVITTDLLGSNGSNISVNGCPGSNNLTNGYTYFGGTSAAAPIVSGACAVILSVNPSLTATEVQDILESTANKVGGYNYNAVSTGKSLEMGYGRINVGAACNTNSSKHNIGNVFSASLYPNPANEVAELKFSLKETDNVNIVIFDAKGSLVDVIAPDIYVLSNQLQTMTINTDKLKSGLYYLVLKTINGRNIQSIPLTIAK